MPIFVSLLSGMVLGLGLIVSGMVDSGKVLGFLDLAGLWDPSLALVMAGAIAVGLVAFALAQRKTRTLLGQDLKLPTARRPDRRLLGGALLFGMGWGLAGLCPGAALTTLGMGDLKAVVFVVAMLVGMGMFELLEQRGAKVS